MSLQEVEHTRDHETRLHIKEGTSGTTGKFLLKISLQKVEHLRNNEIRVHNREDPSGKVGNSFRK